MQGHSPGFALAFALVRAASHCSRLAFLVGSFSKTVPATKNLPWLEQSNPSTSPTLSRGFALDLQIGQITVASAIVLFLVVGEPRVHFGLVQASI